MRKSRVLVVDDSASMRQLISAVLNSAPDMEVVGHAADPLEARQAIKDLSPDVVTLDVEMPNMNGIDFLERLMRLRPMPVIMVSSLTLRGGEITTRALEIGAIDCVTKPSMGDARPFGDLVEKVRMASGVRMGPARVPAGRQGAPVAAAAPQAYSPDGRVVAIGSSTGGVEALTAVLVALPANCAPTVITQHMPPMFTKSFAERLDRLCSASVREATDGAPLQSGTIYIAPGGAQHMEVVRTTGLRCRLREAPTVNGHCPSVDVLFRSVVKAVGGEALGVILTGMGRDGAEGLLALRHAGALTLGQDAASSLIYGMPKVAFEIGAVEKQLPLRKIGSEIVALTNKQNRSKTMPLASALKVIIADDQQTSRLLIRSALTDIGITNVTMAKDGAEALECMMKSPAHLVISDYHMPKLNGVELLRAVRANVPTQKSAFFLLTGVEDKEFLQLAMSLKVNNYLKKPVSVPELKKKIEAVFGALQ